MILPFVTIRRKPKMTIQAKPKGSSLDKEIHSCQVIFLSNLLMLSHRVSGFGAKVYDSIPGIQLWMVGKWGYRLMTSISF